MRYAAAASALSPATMINWIDIVSSELRTIHQEWIRHRHAQLMPDVRQYNQFSGSSLMESVASRSISAIIPADGSAPVLKHVGSALKLLLPHCSAGCRLSEITGAVARQHMGFFLKRVCRSRQPDSRRATQGNGREFEALLLPFGDGAFRVCLVHGVYDLAGVEWKRLFQ